MTKDDQYEQNTGRGHNEGNVSTEQYNLAASNLI